MSSVKNASREACTCSDMVRRAAAIMVDVGLQAKDIDPGRDIVKITQRLEIKPDDVVTSILSDELQFQRLTDSNSIEKQAGADSTKTPETLCLEALPLQKHFGIGLYLRIPTQVSIIVFVNKAFRIIKINNTFFSMSPTNTIRRSWAES